MPDQPNDLLNLQSSFITAGAFRGKKDEPIEPSPPSGLAFSPEGELAIADDFNHRIQVYGVDHKIKFSFGEKGNLNGQMNYPRGLTADNTGCLYVADSWNHRVQKFDRSGNHILTFGSYGDELGQMNEPYDILVEPCGRIIVVERYNHRVQFFDPTGKSQGWIGSRAIVLEDQLAWIYGTPPALFPRPVFELPTSITKDSQGNYFVADSGNHRIVKFNQDWEFLDSFGTKGSNPGEFEYPLSVEAGSNDLLYVSDLNNNRIQVFDSFGQFLLILSAGTKALETPCLNCESPDGRLYVGMTFDTRIEVFETPKISRQKLRDRAVVLHPDSFKVRFNQGQSLQEEQENAIAAYTKAAALITQTPEADSTGDAPLSEDTFIVPLRLAQTIPDQSIDSETEELLFQCLDFYDSNIESLASELINHWKKWIGCTENVSNNVVQQENLILQQKDDPLKFNRELYTAELEERSLFHQMRTLFWNYRYRAERRSEFTDIILNLISSKKSLARYKNTLKKRYLTVCSLIQTCLDEKEKKEEIMIAEFGNGVDEDKKWGTFRSKFMENQKTLDVLRQLQHEFKMVLQQITGFGKNYPEEVSLFNDLFLEVPQAFSLHKILMGFQEDPLSYVCLEQSIFDLFDTWIPKWIEKRELSQHTVTLETLAPIPYNNEETTLEDNIQTLTAEGTQILIKNGKVQLGHKLFSSTIPENQIETLIKKVSAVLENMNTYEKNFIEIFDNLENLTRQHGELNERLKTIDPRDKNTPIPLRNNSYILDFQISLHYRMLRTLEINALNNAFRLVLGAVILSIVSSNKYNTEVLFDKIRKFKTDLSYSTQSNLKKKKTLFFKKAALDNQLQTQFSEANAKAFEERSQTQNSLIEIQLEVHRIKFALNKQLRIQNFLQKLFNFLDSKVDENVSTKSISLRPIGIIQGPNYDQGGFLGLCNIAISSKGILYVVDHIKHKVYRMTTQGKVLGSFGRYGNGPGAMQWPKNIQISRTGKIYISEGTNRCIHVFSLEGRFLFKFGSEGKYALGMPNDLSLDNEENIWVPDATNHCVQIFSPEGKFLKTWKAKGKMELKGPLGICFLDNDMVAISDQTDYLIKTFNTSGDFINGLKKQDHNKNDLYTLTYHSEYGILYSDSWTPQITQLSKDLKNISTFFFPGRRIGQFGVIPDLALNDGLLFVVDYENPKITLFDLKNQRTKN